MMALVMVACLALIGVVLVDAQRPDPIEASAATTDVSALSVERSSVERLPATIDPRNMASISAVACGSSQQGSAFLTTDSVYTAGHVVGDSDVAFLTPHRANSVFSTVADRPVDGEDVTRLLLSDGLQEVDAPGFEIAEEIPARGQTATIAGFPEGGPLSIVAGEILGIGDGVIFGMKADRVVMIDASTGEGFSGGPVVNEAGEVFAVVVALEIGTDTALAIPLADLEMSKFAKHDCGPTSTLAQ